MKEKIFRNKGEQDKVQTKQMLELNQLRSIIKIKTDLRQYQKYFSIFEIKKKNKLITSKKSEDIYEKK
jgi:hypothetical protein